MFPGGRLLTPLSALALLASGAPISLANDVEKTEQLRSLKAQLGGADYTMAMIANLYVASVHCGIGNPAVWERFAEIIDRRIEHCGREVPDFSPRPDYATRALWRHIPEAKRRLEAIVSSDKCSSPAVRCVLDPDSGSECALTDRPDLEMFVSWHKATDNKSADNKKWITMPCTTLWPN